MGWVGGLAGPGFKGENVEKGRGETCNAFILLPCTYETDFEN